MGQKVNPLGIRLGITRDWMSKWYAGKRQFPQHVHTDYRVREFLTHAPEGCLGEPHPHRARREEGEHHHPDGAPRHRHRQEGRGHREAAPGDGEAARHERSNDVRLNIAEIRKPELDSKLVADSIAQQIEKRVMFRRAMKRAVMSTMRSGALGVKVRVSGRLNGSEIARTEWYREGRIPLHTFRADIDYGLSEARTTYGVIGVKVWIFKGEVFDKPQVDQPVSTARAGRERAGRSRACRAAGRAADGLTSERIMLQPKRTKYRKHVQGPQRRLRRARQPRRFR